MNQKLVFLSGADQTTIARKLLEFKDAFLTGSGREWPIYKLGGPSSARISAKNNPGFFENNFVLTIGDHQSCRETFRCTIMDCFDSIRAFHVAAGIGLVCLSSYTTNMNRTDITPEKYTEFILKFLQNFSPYKYYFTPPKPGVYMNSETQSFNKSLMELCGAAILPEGSYKSLRICFPVVSYDVHSAYTTASVLTALLRESAVSFDKNGEPIVGDDLIRSVAKALSYYYSTRIADVSSDRKSPSTDPLFLLWLLIGSIQWGRDYIGYVLTLGSDSERAPLVVTGPSKLIHHMLSDERSRKWMMSQIFAFGKARLNHIFNGFDADMDKVFTSPSSKSFHERLPEVYSLASNNFKDPTFKKSAPVSSSKRVVAKKKFLNEGV